jgi:predicted lipoprotein with Yx(FWY)xxD motif
MTRTRIARTLFALVLATSVGVAAQATVASADTATSAPDKKKPKKKPTVKLAQTTFGKVLVAADGLTLYVFDPDAGDINASKCTGTCAGAWPPLTATGKPKAGKGVDADQLVVGESGQIAYFGHLLYKFSGDSAPGDTNGQGVGGVWHIITADGDPILA